jgi:predicted secreted protein
MAIAGYGAQFRRWNANPDNSSQGAWEKIAEVISIEGPGMDRETIDTTSLDNTDGYRSFIGGLRDAGEVTLSMNFRRDNYEKMKNDYEADGVQNYEIVLPDEDNTSLEFEGVVTGVPITVNTDDRVTSDVTIKVSGKPVLNSGSGS